MNFHINLKINKLKIPTFCFAVLFLTGFLPNFAKPCFAQDYDPRESNYGLDDFDIAIGRESDPESLKNIIAQVINIALGFLGIIAVIIILYAGFRWMTAAGKEDQVGEAKKMIVQAVIGLAIIFLAWAISSFVINQLMEATGA